jgi:hypothetical protein
MIVSNLEVDRAFLDCMQLDVGLPYWGLKTNEVRISIISFFLNNFACKFLKIWGNNFLRNFLLCNALGSLKKPAKHLRQVLKN